MRRCRGTPWARAAGAGRRPRSPCNSAGTWTPGPVSRAAPATPAYLHKNMQIRVNICIKSSTHVDLLQFWGVVVQGRIDVVESDEGPIGHVVQVRPTGSRHCICTHLFYLYVEFIYSDL